MAERPQQTEVQVLPVAREVVRITRRRRVTGRLRVAVTTAETRETLEATLRRSHAEVSRIAIGREVEAAPPIRREGDTIVIPVMEERLVLVRKLVLAEEIHLRVTNAEERVSLPASVRRQAVEIARLPADDPNHSQESPPEMMRTVTALFDTRAEAERAMQALHGLNVNAADIRIVPEAGMAADADHSSALGNLFLPDADRHSYHEGLRRGGTMIAARIEDRYLDHVMDALEAAGAVDLDTREAEWRAQGWTGTTTATTQTSAMGTGMGMGATGATATGHALQGGSMPEADRLRAAGTATGREEAIPIVEESLRVGKREVRSGRVRVRSYVVETPVEEQVRLREEHVHVERRAVDRPVSGTEANLFQDRVIEATETSEEAVVSKEARVTEEVVVSKETTERTETIRDTVRRTEVEIDQDATANDPLRGDTRRPA